MGRWWLIMLAVSLLVAGCASLPVKQRATMSLQAAERALGAIQDAERALCDPASVAGKPVTHCPGPIAAAAGLTDARHQAFAKALAVAFTVESKAAVALASWRAGDPPPQTLVELQRDIQDVLALVRQLGGNNPAVQGLLVQVQAALDALLQALKALQVH